MALIHEDVILIFVFRGSHQQHCKEVSRMGKTFTLFVTTSPYSGENTLTSVRIAESALDKSHVVNLIASGDGVYCFLKGQKARGITNAEETFAGLIRKGLKVYL
jgi:sulfur relay (sulfurtransferase) complex TusBCD TusD component (DsrE family)